MADKKTPMHATQHLEGATPQHLQAIHELADAGIPWGDLWTLFSQYAWPYVSQVLLAFLAVLSSGKKIDTSKILQWLTAALAAAAAGQPLPALPTV